MSLEAERRLILIDAMLDHLTDHPDIDPDRYADHTATVLLDGIADPNSQSVRP